MARIAVDVADTAVLQVHPYSASARAHVAGRFFDLVADGLAQFEISMRHGFPLRHSGASRNPFSIHGTGSRPRSSRPWMAALGRDDVSIRNRDGSRSRDTLAAMRACRHAFGIFSVRLSWTATNAF